MISTFLSVTFIAFLTLRLSSFSLSLSLFFFAPAPQVWHRRESAKIGKLQAKHTEVLRDLRRQMGQKWAVFPSTSALSHPPPTTFHTFAFSHTHAHQHLPISRYTHEDTYALAHSINSHRQHYEDVINLERIGYLKKELKKAKSRILYAVCIVLWPHPLFSFHLSLPFSPHSFSSIHLDSEYNSRASANQGYGGLSSRHHFGYRG